MFANRTDWEKRLNRLTQRLTELKKSGRTILDLTESNPTRCQFHYPPELLTVLNDPRNFTYAPSPKGLLSARQAIASYYAEKGVSLDPEQVLLTASTSEAYSFLFRLLLSPKEHLLAPRPSYPLFEYLASLNDSILESYPLVYREGWRIQLEALEKTIDLKTRAMILVHPNNPTGSFVKKEEKEVLMRIARENNFSLICDEVFLDYAYQEDASRVATFAECDGILTFTLSGISKILAMPQMKLSWIVVNGPKELRDEAIERLEVISDTYLSVNTPSQLALEKWLSFRPVLQSQIRNRILFNRNFLLEQCRKHSSCELLCAEGGWYAALRLPEMKSEEVWALEFLEKESVLVHPGYFFDFEKDTHIILSLLPPPDRFEAGIQKLLHCAGAS